MKIPIIKTPQGYKIPGHDPHPTPEAAAAAYWASQNTTNQDQEET